MHTQRRYEVVESGSKDKIIRAADCIAGQEFICHYVGIKEYENTKPKKGENGKFESFVFKLAEDCTHNKSILKAGTFINVSGTAFSNMKEWLAQKRDEKALLAVIFEGVKKLDSGLPYNMWDVLHISNVTAYQASATSIAHSEDSDEELGLDDEDEAGLDA